MSNPPLELKEILVVDIISRKIIIWLTNVKLKKLSVYSLKNLKYKEKLFENLFLFISLGQNVLVFM